MPLTSRWLRLIRVALAMAPVWMTSGVAPNRRSGHVDDSTYWLGAKKPIMMVYVTECPIYGAEWAVRRSRTRFDNFLLFWTITFLGPALVPAFARHYWWLGLILSLISVGMVVVFVLSVFVPSESHSESGPSAANFPRVAA